MKRHDDDMEMAAPEQSLITHEDGSQTLVRVYRDGSVSVARRDTQWDTWGRPETGAPA